MIHRKTLFLTCYFFLFLVPRLGGVTPPKRGYVSFSADKKVFGL
ncbi:Uncharacterized protein dnm_090480 [Desulfonema magnum]|uniref:Uncharacterized protein n=1 Tax=Desulfonema magnum TaxID=45655 RepID=A0A975GTB8_9BACT|nr:Uncharacterized protein dnm_090480 [Desulfonema magnum]